MISSCTARHEFEVVRTIRACHPHLRRRPVATRIALGIHRDPVGMRRLRVVIRRVRIGADKHRHIQLAAPRDQFTQHIAIPKPDAAMVKRNLGRIVRNAPASTQTDAVRSRAFEVVQPESQIKMCGIIFNQRELRPAHRLCSPCRRYARCRRSDTSKRKAQGSRCECGGSTCYSSCL